MQTYDRPPIITKVAENRMKNINHAASASAAPPGFQFLIRFQNKTYLFHLGSLLGSNLLKTNNNDTNILNRSLLSNLHHNDIFNHISKHDQTLSRSSLESNLLNLLSVSCSIPFFFLSFSQSSISSLNKLLSTQQSQNNKSYTAVSSGSSLVGPQTIVTFLTATISQTHSAILGGKGGFGTLLRQQSKKSGAKTTTDFGACRDLNGRRLRHVNDEIKLRLWRDAQAQQAQVQSGGGVAAAAASTAAAKIPGWHLAVPNWAEINNVSSKSKRKEELRLQREYSRELEEQLKRKQREEEENNARDMMIIQYANQGSSNAMNNNLREEDNDGGMEDAIQQGLMRRKKMKLQKEEQSKLSTTNNTKEEDKNWLCSLSGEIITLNTSPSEFSNNSFPNTTYVTGQSEFATGCVLLHDDEYNSNNNGQNHSHHHQEFNTYYEVVLETDGLIQIGFANLSSLESLSSADSDQNQKATGENTASNNFFAPNSDTGDGVGDDHYSWSFDPSRNKIFHGEKEYNYPSSSIEILKKKKAVIGCWFNPKNGQISFFYNGTWLGVAFETDLENIVSPTSLVPAFSLNQGEIIGLRAGRNNHQSLFEYSPYVEDTNKSLEMESDSMETTPLVADSTSTSTTTTTNNNNYIGKNEKEEASKLPASTSLQQQQTQNHSSSSSILSSSNNKNSKLEPLNLMEYNSVDALMELGMERLKNELLALGVKCG